MQQQFSEDAEKLIDHLLQGGPPALSAITEIELLCWKSATEKDLEILTAFIGSAYVIELEQQIKIKTAEIRKVSRIKLPDAIIAATALIYDITLITRNVQDFQSIQGLKVINPWDYKSTI